MIRTTIAAIGRGGHSDRSHMEPDPEHRSTVRTIDLDNLVDNARPDDTDRTVYGVPHRALDGTPWVPDRSVSDLRTADHDWLYALAQHFNRRGFDPISNAARAYVAARDTPSDTVTSRCGECGGELRLACVICGTRHNWARSDTFTEPTRRNHERR